MTNTSEGYDKLAQVMGACSSAAVFRRFSSLSVENLLYLQADLVRLEKELHRVQQEDKASGHKDRIRYCLDWTLILDSENSTADPGNDSRQLALILEIREKLNQYNQALLHQRQILSFKQPHTKALKDLTDWMDSPTRGAIGLIGDDADVWRKPDMADLVSLDEISEDVLTEWVSNHLLDLYHDNIGRRVHKKDCEKAANLEDTIIYTGTTIQKITRSLTIVIAGSMPVLATLVLYLVQDMAARLGIIAAFTALFSLALALCTRASVQEIFTATAAFAAVSVVWVGTTDTSTK